MSEPTEELKPCPLEMDIRDWSRVVYCDGVDGANEDRIIDIATSNILKRIERNRHRADDWQPIDDAPKDGSPIDLFAGGKRIPDAIWDGCRWVRWVVTQGWKEVFNPTHFRHLPQPPKEGQP